MFEVVWTQTALNHLAAAWTRADSAMRQDITRAPTRSIGDSNPIPAVRVSREHQGSGFSSNPLSEWLSKSARTVPWCGCCSPGVFGIAVAPDSLKYSWIPSLFFYQ